MGYSHTVISISYSRAIKTPRGTLLTGCKYQAQSDEQPIHFIGTHCKQWQAINSVLKKHWHILQTDPTLVT